MSLRLSHTQIVLAVAGAVLLATDLYLGVAYLGSQDQRGRLLGQFQTLARSLDELQAVRSTPLAQDDLAFPRNLPGAELTDLVVRSARDSGTEVLGLHASPIAIEQIGAGTYRVVRINVRLRGAPTRVTDFLDRVERGAVPTMVLDNFESGGSDTWEVSLDLTAYAEGS